MYYAQAALGLPCYDISDSGGDLAALSEFFASGDDVGHKLEKTYSL